MLDIDCRISSVDGITRSAPVSKSKLDTGFSQAEMPYNLCIHVQHVGGRCNHKNLHGIQNII